LNLIFKAQIVAKNKRVVRLEKQLIFIITTLGMFRLDGKQAVIFGVASEESIAWAIAQELHAAGAAVTLGYQMRFKSRILQLLKQNPWVHAAEKVDVTEPAELARFFELCHHPVDILVHSVAYAPPETFAQPVEAIQRADFEKTLTTSAYSLLAVVRAAQAFMSQEASVMTLTYLGGTRVVANYKIMGIAKAALDAAMRELAVSLGPQGIRVNAISAGPIRTLAANQIAGFEDMLRQYEQTAPLRRCVHQQDIGKMAVFLGSSAARNLTGQVLYVDAGYSILAMA
jgi:enoyl-[acyl-carrier protein] reductase I